jgi:hypothetical protein
LDVIDRPQNRLAEDTGDVRNQRADRRKDTRRWWYQRSLHAEQPGEITRMHRSGAAERDQREVARIVAALDRDHP